MTVFRSQRINESNREVRNKLKGTKEIGIKGGNVNRSNPLERELSESYK